MIYQKQHSINGVVCLFLQIFSLYFFSSCSLLLSDYGHISEPGPPAQFSLFVRMPEFSLVLQFVIRKSYWLQNCRWKDYLKMMLKYSTWGNILTFHHWSLNNRRRNHMQWIWSYTKSTKLYIYLDDPCNQTWFHYKSQQGQLLILIFYYPGTSNQVECPSSIRHFVIYIYISHHIQYVTVMWKATYIIWSFM